MLRIDLAYSANMFLEWLAAILEILCLNARTTVTGICAQLDLPKPKANRLVQDLVSAGPLVLVVQDQFSIGTLLKRFEYRDHFDHAVLEVIAPILADSAAHQSNASFPSRLRGLLVEINQVVVPETGLSSLHPGLDKWPLEGCSWPNLIVAVSPDFLSITRLKGLLRACTKNLMIKP